MLNKVDLIGRLVREPEYRALNDGTSVCNFTLAVDDDYKDADGQKVMDFIDCTAWRQAAEFVTRYLTKGMLMAVSGRLKSRKWTDKDGNRRTSWFVKCDNCYSCEARKDGVQNQQSGYAPAPAYPVPTTGNPVVVEAGTDFPMLTDDDANLPF